MVATLSQASVNWGRCRD